MCDEACGKDVRGAVCDEACGNDVRGDNRKLIMERKIKAGLLSSALVLRVWKLFARILCVAALAILVLPVSS